jgi:antitoxin Phd
MRNLWQLQEAKSKFSEMVERTLAHGAQIITRRGRKTVVVLPYEEYQRLAKRDDSLVQFLLASPLAGADLAIDRDQSTPRSIEIEP